MPIAEARVPTAHAASYLRQLCRHWAHKYPVTFDPAAEPASGRIELPKAVCTLQAGPAHLVVRVETHMSQDEPHMLAVIAEHLQRFGFREQLVFDWQHAF